MPATPTPPMPARDRLEAALGLLEPFGAHPATGPIHDPLYELLNGGNASHLQELREALIRHRDHPVAPALRQVLGAELGLPERSLSDVLTAWGSWTFDDPVDEVEARLSRQAEQRAALQDRITRLSDENARLVRSSDALALVGAILGVLALVGWLGALDVWTIDWMTPPEPPPDGVPQEQKP